MMKCRKCGELRDESEFPKTYIGRRQTICRECAKEYNAKRVWASKAVGNRELTDTVYCNHCEKRLSKDKFHFVVKREIRPRKWRKKLSKSLSQVHQTRNYKGQIRITYLEDLTYKEALAEGGEMRPRAVCKECEEDFNKAYNIR